jgi:hypothetical protein
VAADAYNAARPPLLTNLDGKLGVSGRAEAVAYAMAHGLA